MNDKKDYWLTDEVGRVQDPEIAEGMAIIVEHYMDVHRKNPEKYDKKILAYGERISHAYGVEEAKNKFLAGIRKIFNECK